MNPHLFVYGTLRLNSTHEMARYLHANSTYIGRGRMPGTVYDFGEYPGAVFDEKSGSMVEGDVFYLFDPEEMLARLDACEGIGYPFEPPYEYVRAEKLICFADEFIKSWVYLLNVEDLC